MSESTLPVVVSGGSSHMERFMPVLTLQALEERRLLIEACKKEMVEGVDYGPPFPGSTKPILLQPGADKLNALFGLVPIPEIVRFVEGWGQAGQEPFFYYLVCCRVMRGDHVQGMAYGSCNSWESKYRWREAKLTCPLCGAQAIIRTSEQYGPPGWKCWGKRGGCGATWALGNPVIESQPRGLVRNEAIFDLVNTVLKLAVKRSKVSATLNAVDGHRYFDVDLEDIDPLALGRSPAPPPPDKPVAGAAAPVAATSAHPAATPAPPAPEGPAPSQADLQTAAFRRLQEKFHLRGLDDLWKYGIVTVGIAAAVRDNRIGQLDRIVALEAYQRLEELLQTEHPEENRATADSGDPPRLPVEAPAAPAAPAVSKVVFEELSEDEVSFCLAALRKLNKTFTRQRLVKWVYDFPGTKAEMLARLRGAEPAGGQSHA